MTGRSANIAEFYAGKSVFLTGVTGFVGKAILEKLLRSCPGLLFIFVLIRENVKGKTAKQRLQDVLKSPLFDRLRTERPEALKKVKALKGDVTIRGLGLSHEDERYLREVAVVIHAAASIKFNEPLKDLIQTNVVGTINMVSISASMERLQAFVYVSTAYSNCNKREILESVYPTTLTPKMVVEATARMTETEVASYVQCAMEGRPNYYTFTKSLAEQVVDSYKDILPVCIVRPSIVSGSLSEPVSGWVDNYNGANGVLVAILYGFLRCLRISSRDSTLDIIPVDLVANLIIASAWAVGSTCDKRSRPMVLHCCSRGANPIKLQTLFETSRRAAHYYPLENVLWYPSMVTVPWRAMYSVVEFFLHVVPYQFLDLGAEVIGKKPRFMRLYSRMSDMTNLLDFFLNNEFQFSMRKTTSLFNQLRNRDKRLFNFNPDTICWTPYIYNYVAGIRRLVMHAAQGDLMASRARLKRLYYLHNALKGIVSLVLIILPALAFVHTLGLNYNSAPQGTDYTA